MVRNAKRSTSHFVMEGLVQDLFCHIFGISTYVYPICPFRRSTQIDLFGLTLGGIGKACWLSELEKAKAALLEAGDPDGSIQLDDVINAFIALYCDEEACDTQLAYVRNVHKPYDSMSIRDFQMNLENCNSIAGWMPGTAPILTLEELKRALFQAMPHRRQVSYMQYTQ